MIEDKEQFYLDELLACKVLVRRQLPMDIRQSPYNRHGVYFRSLTKYSKLWAKVMYQALTFFK